MYIWGLIAAWQFVGVLAQDSPTQTPVRTIPTSSAESTLCFVCMPQNIFTATSSYSSSPETIINPATTTEVEEELDRSIIEDLQELDFEIELVPPQQDIDIQLDHPDPIQLEHPDGTDPIAPIPPVLSPASSIPESATNFSSLNNSTNITDECHFMSFEEWKKLKIELEEKNTSETAENTSSTRNVSSKVSPSKLAFVNSTQIPPSSDEGKVYKDKFNYASVDCAATVVKTNSLAKGASSILFENKDSYLLNQCSLPNKFVIIELCQDILVDSVVIGNFEFFSSMFKEIRVSVSDRFPSTTWKVLGEFEAQNVRDLQSFKIQNPFIWARYLKLEVLSHYGNEFYCPISVVRVHGKTMMEEFKEEEEEKEDILPITIDNFTTTINDSIDKCRVVLPHLVLNEFLKDINSTYDYCDVVYPETTATSEPTTQESIYKNIMKRLSLLESNATLSLLYVEEQSKLLSTAFTSLERRQTHNFDILISNFNATLSSQLSAFKSSYLKMYNEYSSLLKIQEKHHKSLLRESSAKLHYLSNELTFQHRITIFNSVIIVCLLVYVLVTRDAYVEVEKNKKQFVFPRGSHKVRKPKSPKSRHSPKPRPTPKFK